MRGEEEGDQPGLLSRRGHRGSGVPAQPAPLWKRPAKSPSTKQIMAAPLLKGPRPRPALSAPLRPARHPPRAELSCRGRGAAGPIEGCATPPPPRSRGDGRGLAPPGCRRLGYGGERAVRPGVCGPAGGRLGGLRVGA